jgi:hypothetical protein
VDINIGKSRLQDEGRSFKIASSAVLVLCLNLGITNTFRCREKLSGLRNSGLFLLMFGSGPIWT